MYGFSEMMYKKIITKSNNIRNCHKFRLLAAMHLTADRRQWEKSLRSHLTQKSKKHAFLNLLVVMLFFTSVSEFHKILRVR